MTLKEIAKKVETYNELAEVMGADKIELHINDVDGVFKVTHKVTTWKDTQKVIKSEYRKDIAQLILKTSDYEIDREVSIAFTKWDGTTGNITIEINLCRQ